LPPPLLLLLLHAVHADGTLEYDAHNLFGTAMALRSAKAATEVIGKRPFFLLRCVSAAICERCIAACCILRHILL
jgi:hypothetical protein